MFPSPNSALNLESVTPTPYLSADAWAAAGPAGQVAERNKYPTLDISAKSKSSYQPDTYLPGHAVALLFAPSPRQIVAVLQDSLAWDG